MSLRVRVLLLVTLVAGGATVATAWLTLRQASAQISQSITADEQQVEQISRELREYGYRHGTWERVAGTVAGLGARTGQRIRLVTEAGTVISDTDTLSGRPARPTDSAPRLVDPVPALRLSPGLADPDEVTLREISAYRQGVLLAACLTRKRVGVTAVENAHGVLRFTPEPVAAPSAGPDRVGLPTGGPATGGPPTGSTATGGTPTAGTATGGAASGGPAAAGKPRDGRQAEPAVVAECRRRAVAAESGRDQGGDREAVAACRRPEADLPLLTCLRSAFRRQVEADAVAPVRMLVHLGARGEVPSPLEPGPVLVAALGVGLLALAGTVLLTRHVVRPIRTLTGASQRLGQGDLTERVPVSSNDEIATLARSFNRMADSLQRGEERQRRLMADVAHELRTPLQNLRGYLEALKDGVIEPDPDLFASLHEEAVLQQRIVDDLQDLALAEAGSLAYHRAPVDLTELVETSRAAHHAVAEAGGVSLLARAAGPVPVFADPDRLRQVLGNLVANALRATPPGGTVSVRAYRNADGQAGVEVADTGTGIAPEALPFVFDRFWRADSARGRRTGGSGLGLAIVRQIVSDHDGTIAVRSELGRGTTFTISLPGSTAGPDEPPTARHGRVQTG